MIICSPFSTFRHPSRVYYHETKYQHLLRTRTREIKNRFLALQAPAHICTNTLQLKNRIFYFKLLSSVTSKMALTFCASKICCPTVEWQPNPIDIKGRG